MNYWHQILIHHSMTIVVTPNLRTTLHLPNLLSPTLLLTNFLTPNPPSLLNPINLLRRVRYHQFSLIHHPMHWIAG